LEPFRTEEIRRLSERNQDRDEADRVHTAPHLNDSTFDSLLAKMPSTVHSVSTKQFASDLASEVSIAATTDDLLVFSDELVDSGARQTNDSRAEKGGNSHMEVLRSNNEMVGRVEVKNELGPFVRTCSQSIPTFDCFSVISTHSEVQRLLGTVLLSFVEHTNVVVGWAFILAFAGTSLRWNWYGCN